MPAVQRSCNACEKPARLQSALPQRFRVLPSLLGMSGKSALPQRFRVLPSLLGMSGKSQLAQHYGALDASVATTPMPHAAFWHESQANSSGVQSQGFQPVGRAPQPPFRGGGPSRGGSFAGRGNGQGRGPNN